MNDDDGQPDEDAWVAEQRSVVIAYLKRQGVQHREVGEWPAWHLLPYLAVWAIESFTAPGRVVGGPSVATCPLTMSALPTPTIRVRSCVTSRVSGLRFLLSCFAASRTQTPTSAHQTGGPSWGTFSTDAPSYSAAMPMTTLSGMTATPKDKVESRNRSLNPLTLRVTWGWSGAELVSRN